MVALVILEHYRSNRPSQPPALYLLVNAVFLAARVRTVALLSPSVLAPLTPLAVCLGFTVALFLSLQFSTRSSLQDGASLPPAATVGLLSRYFIVWVLPVLFRGYRKPLEMETVGSIDTSLHSLPTWQAMQPWWEKQAARFAKHKTKQPIALAAILAFKSLWLAPVLPYVILSVASLGRPLIINRAIIFVQSYQSGTPQLLVDGWGLVAAAFLTYFVYAIATALAHIAVQKSAMALRGALMEALYRKSLVIKVDAARELGAAKGEQSNECGRRLYRQDGRCRARLLVGIVADWARTVPHLHPAWPLLRESRVRLATWSDRRI